MTPHRWSFGPRVLQASGALLIAGLMAGCGATSAQSGQITAPAQNVRPAPPAASPAEQSAPQPGTATSTATSTGSTGSRATPTTAEVRHQPSKVERCHTSMLTGSLQNSEAGAGQRYAQLVLQNTSEQTCTLYGYGGMQLVNESGKPLPTTMERTPNPGPNLITLAPGQSASATLHWTAVPHEGEPTDGPCQPTPVSAQVIPPDETDALAVTWNLGPVCGFGAINNSAYHQ
ncbi:DUF4232 domain-containing protein [Saccharopolyspora sp. NPDC000995]